MQSRIAKNYIYSLLYKMLDILVPLLTAPYLARVLGRNGIGIYAYTNSIATFFILLASVGINIYGQREIAYVQNDPIRRTRLFWQILGMRVALLLVTGSAYWVGFAMQEPYKQLYRILSMTLIANALDISWFFQGMEDFKKTSVRNAIVRLAGVVLVFLFVHDEDDLFLYALLVSLTTLLGNMSLWLYLPRYLASVTPDWRQTVTHIRPVAALFIPQLAIEIYTVLDKSMLGGLGASMAEVAYYEQSQKIVKIGLRFLTALGPVMLSRVSNIYADEGNAGVQRSIQRSFQFTFFLGIPVMLGTMGVAPNLIPWFFGAGYEAVSPLVILISPIILCIGVSNIIGTQYLIPTRQQRKYSLSVIGGAALNCGLNWLLIPRWNALGASIASVCAESFVALIQIVFIHDKLPYMRYFKESWKNWLSGCVMLVLVLGIGCILPVSPLCTAMQVLAGTAVYYGALLLLKDSFAIRILQLIFQTKRL